MPKKYSKKSVKRKNRKYSKKSRKSVYKRSYSRKKRYGGSININKQNSTNSTNFKNVNNTKSVNTLNITNSEFITKKSIDGIPVVRNAVIDSSNTFSGTPEEYRRHKEYMDFQGKKDL
jgi:hypothetical protein